MGEATAICSSVNFDFFIEKPPSRPDALHEMFRSLPGPLSEENTSSSCTKNSVIRKFNFFIGKFSEKLGYISHLESAHQIKPVDFNGSDTNIQVFSNFPICVALGRKAKNFFLSSSERGWG